MIYIIYALRSSNGNKSFPLPIGLTYILIRVPLVEQHRHHPLVDLPVEVLSHLCFQNKYKKMKIYILQDLITFRFKNSICAKISFYLPVSHKLQYLRHWSFMKSFSQLGSAISHQVALFWQTSNSENIIWKDNHNKWSPCYLITKLITTHSLSHNKSQVISWQVRFLEKSSALVNQVDKCAKKVVRGEKLTSALSENLILRKWYFLNVFSIVFSRKKFSAKRQFDIFYYFLANSRFLLPLNRKKSSKTRIFVLFCLDNLT